MTPMRIEYKPEPYNKVKLTLAKDETRIKVGAEADPELVRRLEQFATVARETIGELKSTLRGRGLVKGESMNCDLYSLSRSGHRFAYTVSFTPHPEL